MPQNTTIVIIVLLIFLAALISALIVSEKFRKDVIGGPGQAKVLGVLSVEGVVVVLLCGILCGSILYTLNFEDPIKVIEDPRIKDIDKRIKENKSTLDLILSTDRDTLLIKGTPIGVVVAFAGPENSIPDGWLLCDGSTRKRDEYNELFKKIGTIHGSGDGVTEFNLPDYRGRFLRGTDLDSQRDPGRNERKASNPGGNSGNTIGTIQGDEIKSHTHLQRTDRNGYQNASGAFKYTGAPVSTTFENTSNMLKNFGGHETRPVNASVNWLIKY